MATADQLQRAAEKTRGAFEELLDTSFEDGKAASDKIFALIEGRAEEEHLSDTVGLDYTLEYNAVLCDLEGDELVNSGVDPYGPDANLEAQAKAVHALLQREDVAQEFGEQMPHTRIDEDMFTESIGKALHANSELIHSPKEVSLEESLALEDSFADIEHSL